MRKIVTHWDSLQNSIWIRPQLMSKILPSEAGTETLEDPALLESCKIISKDLFCYVKKIGSSIFIQKSFKENIGKISLKCCVGFLLLFWFNYPENIIPQVFPNNRAFLPESSRISPLAWCVLWTFPSFPPADSTNSPILFILWQVKRWQSLISPPSKQRQEFFLSDLIFLCWGVGWGKEWRTRSGNKVKNMSSRPWEQSNQAASCNKISNKEIRAWSFLAMWL